MHLNSLWPRNTVLISLVTHIYITNHPIFHICPGEPMKTAPGHNGLMRDYTCICKMRGFFIDPDTCSGLPCIQLFISLTIRKLSEGCDLWPSNRWVEEGVEDFLSESWHAESQLHPVKAGDVIDSGQVCCWYLENNVVISWEIHNISTVISNSSSRLAKPHANFFPSQISIPWSTLVLHANCTSSCPDCHFLLSSKLIHEPRDQYFWRKKFA